MLEAACAETPMPVKLVARPKRARIKNLFIFVTSYHKEEFVGSKYSGEEGIQWGNADFYVGTRRFCVVVIKYVLILIINN